MKLGFTFKDIKVGDKANIGEINIQVQYAPGEMVGEYELFKRALKEIPEIVGDLGAGAIAFDEMDEAMNTLADAKTAEGATTETNTTARNLVKNLIASIKGQLPKANAEQKPVKEKEAV